MGVVAVTVFVQWEFRILLARRTMYMGILRVMETPSTRDTAPRQRAPSRTTNAIRRAAEIHRSGSRLPTERGIRLVGQGRTFSNSPKFARNHHPLDKIENTKSNLSTDTSSSKKREKKKKRTCSSTILSARKRTRENSVFPVEAEQNGRSPVKRRSNHYERERERERDTVDWSWLEEEEKRILRGRRTISCSPMHRERPRAQPLLPSPTSTPCLFQPLRLHAQNGDVAISLCLAMLLYGESNLRPANFECRCVQVGSKLELLLEFIQLSAFCNSNMGSGPSYPLKKATTARKSRGRLNHER
ncbi:hypothetical protein ANTRET_LOCUS1778, partial [Anthophora retusa]